MKKVLVVAPHPDDETLGLGGTLLKHRDEGDETYWMIATEISENDNHTIHTIHKDHNDHTNHKDHTDITDHTNDTDHIIYTNERVAKRESEIQKVAKHYSFKDVFRLGYATASLDIIPNRELISCIFKVINRLKPHTLYVPYRNDIHTDHRVVFDAVMSAIKPFRCPSVKGVLLYETLSETEFVIRPDDGGFKPNVWIDVEKYIEEKCRIMEIYKSEIAPHPFPRSQKNMAALATFRGAMVNLKAAEAFMLVRQIC